MILPIVAYTGGIFRPRGVPFQALVGKYMKGQGFHYFKYIKNFGNLSFWSVIEPKKGQTYFVDVKETRKLPSSVIDLYSKEGAKKAINV